MLPSDKDNLGRDVLDQARHDALVENTAQGIFYEIQELENHRSVNQQRWVWELLQNALDATRKGNNTTLRISWDGIDVAFEHNGDPFSPEELAHLIYHGSTKYRDPTKRGKFGRGFLVTHLLSKKVRVIGLEQEPGGVFSFDVELDRSGDAEEIRRKMDSAWQDFEKSRQLVDSGQRHTDFHSTQYVYRVDNDGKAALDSGIRAAKLCVAYALAFIPELGDVVLSELGIETSWKKEKVWDDSSDRSLRFTRVRHKEVQQLHGDVSNQQGDCFDILTKLVGAQADQNAVGVALMVSGEEVPQVIMHESIPRFFAVGLPIVGTEHVPLPIVVYSEGFEVEANRTGIHLEGKQTTQQEQNWKLLSQAPVGCIDLIRYGSDHKWDQLHLLAGIGTCPSIDWLDSAEFTKSVLQPVAQRILDDSAIRLVRTVSGELVSVKESVVPLDDQEGKLFDLLSAWKPAKQGLVDKTLSGFWSGALHNLANAAASDIEKLEAAWSIERLASEVSACGNIRQLSENVDLQQDQNVIDWLSNVISLVIASSKESLLMKLGLLPDQHGELRKHSELSHDPGVSDDLKDIAMTAGIDERSMFLDKRVTGMEGKLKLRDRTELEVLNALFGAINKLQPDQNAKLLAWLVDRPSYSERLNSYPVTTLGAAQTLDKKRALLKPVTKWSNGSASFADLFPKDFTLAEVYALQLSDGCWKVLEDTGFVHSSVVYTRDESDLERCIQELPNGNEKGDDEETVEHKVSIKVTDIAFLEEKDRGIIDTVRHSQAKCRRFLRLIFDWLLRSDRSWSDAVTVSCSCRNDHKVFACGWLSALKGHEWIPLAGKKYGLATAENMARLLDESLLSKLATDDDSSTFLQRLGIGVSDLFRLKIADPKERLQADRLAAKMYAHDSQTRAILSAFLDDPDMRELAEKHLEEKKLAKRNRDVGSKVEQLIRQALETEHISVQRTGIGSDYELEYDFVENGQEQGLAVGKYLLEVKATSADDVRMTLSQGNMAANVPSDYDGYILCVCTVDVGDTVTEESIKTAARFMFDINSAVKDALDSGNALREMESTLKGKGGHGVHLELGQSPKRLRVSRDAWLRGVDFNEAMLRLKASDGSPNASV